MRSFASGRITHVVGKYAEHAPVATTCCNACRTCVQTNLLGIALGAVVALAAGARRAALRLGVRA